MKRKNPAFTPNARHTYGKRHCNICAGMCLVSNPAAVALGRLGGKAKAAKLTAEQRSENARKAGKAGGRGRPKLNRAEA